MSKTKKDHWHVCPRCGSNQVYRDAIAVWSEAEQAWTLGTVLDSAHCDGCPMEDVDPEVDDEAEHA